MARRYELPNVYSALRDQMEAAVTRVIDSRDPDALVHVGLTAMGRIHVIVVSERLGEAPQSDREEWLWQQLDERVPAEAVARVSVLEVLSPEEAIQLSGPADTTILIPKGEELLVRWREWLAGTTHEPDGAAPLESLLSDTRAWARTSTLMRLDASIVDLDRELESMRRALRESEGIAQDRLDRVPSILESAIDVLRQPFPDAHAA